MNDFCLTMQPIAQAHGLYLQAQGPKSLPVDGDQSNIRRIVQNLVLNALKYTQEGGVVVAWERSQDSDADRWMISVCDTGPGFETEKGITTANQLRVATQAAQAMEDKARTLGTSSSRDEPAVTYASQSLLLRPLSGQAGEGIGFSIVKGLCDLLDATLEIETSAGQGSTFRVTFPCRYSD